MQQTKRGADRGRRRSDSSTCVGWTPDTTITSLNGAVWHMVPNLRWGGRIVDTSPPAPTLSTRKEA